MKKIITLALLGLLILSLVGCGTPPSSEVASPSSSPSSQSKAESQPPSQDGTEPNVESKQQIKPDEKSNSTANPSSAIKEQAPVSLTKEKAKSIALNHANLKESAVNGLEVEKDFERTTPVYEVEFRHGGNKYEYEIHGETGKILSAEKNDISLLSPANTSMISPEKAKSVALSHAKLSANTVRELQVELDTEKGVQIYEVEFEKDGYEYHYVIHAHDGNILRQNKSLD